jgi:xylulokinase
MHGATVLDDRHRPLRPCILWNDARSSAECRALEAAAPFRALGGNIVMPGFTAPKLAWIRTHEPEVFENTDKVLLPKDFVRLKLTGECISDMSDSAGTLWMDVARRDWSDELLAATGLDRAQMPSLVEGSAPGGNLRAELASRWGMRTPPIVAGGAGDNAASACGVGSVVPGSGFLSVGTSGVLFVARAECVPNPDRAVHTFCHAVREVWHQMGVILAATDSLNWLARLSGKDPAVLTCLVDDSRRPEGRITFLPYLSGERTPHNEPNALGTFSGLGMRHELADVVCAVLEGVAYAFVDSLDALRQTSGAPDTVYAVGGGARSDAWLRIIASATGLVLQRPSHMDRGAAFGAARLAICACEGAAPADICTPPEVDAVFEPDSASSSYHEEGLARYRALYPAVREAMSSKPI